MNDTRKKDRKHSDCKGFTLVELLLVVAILGILAGVVLMNTQGMSGEARINATRSSIAAIEQAVKVYELRNGKYPDSLDQLAQGGSDGQSALINQNQLNDSWGIKFGYRKTGNSFEIRSAGPDGQQNTADDILNASASGN